MFMPTEKLFKDLNKYIDSLENPPQSVEEWQKILDEFSEKHNAAIETEEPLTEENAETAEDFLELAAEAKTKKKALQYVTKACELDENNIDAQTRYISLTAKNEVDALERYKNLLVKSEKQLKANGLWNAQSIGNFWGIIETRPHMRLCMTYMSLLEADGRLTQAVTAGKEILKLNKNDNLGVRYKLLHIYALLEDVGSAEKLYRKYPERGSVHAVLPLCLLYYKIGNEEKAEKLLKQLAEKNSDIPKFFRDFGSSRLSSYIIEHVIDGCYSPGTMSEILSCMNENETAYKSTPTFFDFGKKVFKNFRVSRKKNNDLRKQFLIGRE